ncbi:NAD(P)H-binding protein [Nonomuraea longicatena]|uniref:NAD(P)H-binding protein n=1 Tax=Nonomuraea longicatena TaxID=83682 RepID=A0ABN1P5G7_9ACTN
MTVLVTGATGTVGRQIVKQLVERGERVRALSRNPARANLPAPVEVAFGDLADAGSLAPALEGVTRLHLVTFGGAELYAPLDNGKEIVELARRAGVERVSVLTGWDEGSVEAALGESDLPWTQIKCVEFMANVREWVPSVRDESVVRMFGNWAGSSVHEADIAAVAVTALLEDGHAGRSYTLTGPELLTPEQRVRLIGAALGREIRFEELTEQGLREQMRGWGADEETIEFAVMLGADPPAVGMTVLPTVEEVTGRPGRTFAEWVAENVGEFRA